MARFITWTSAQNSSNPTGTISKEVMKDGLHLGSKGFDIWAEAIQEKVKELTDDAPSGQKTPAKL